MEKTSLEDIMKASLKGKTIEVYEFKPRGDIEPDYIVYMLKDVKGAKKVSKVINDIEFVMYDYEPMSIYIKFDGGTLYVDINTEIIFK